MAITLNSSPGSHVVSVIACIPAALLQERRLISGQSYCLQPILFLLREPVWQYTDE